MKLIFINVDNFFYVRLTIFDEKRSTFCKKKNSSSLTQTFKNKKIKQLYHNTKPIIFFLFPKKPDRVKRGPVRVVQRYMRPGGILHRGGRSVPSVPHSSHSDAQEPGAGEKARSGSRPARARDRLCRVHVQLQPGPGR